MKKLLLVSSLFLFFVAWSCNPKPGQKTTKEEISDTDKVITHGSEDQAKMDSIKAAKTKGKN